MADLYERARLVARGEAGRGLPHRSALSGEGGVNESSPGTRSADVAAADTASTGARSWSKPSSASTSPPAESAEIPESCSFCGEPVKVVSYFFYDDERLAPFGVRGEDTWARLTCKCGAVELLVRAKELA